MKHTDWLSLVCYGVWENDGQEDRQRVSVTSVDTCDLFLDMADPSSGHHHLATTPPESD